MNSPTMIDLMLGAVVLLVMGIIYFLLQRNSVERKRQDRLSRLRTRALSAGKSEAGGSANLRRQQKQDRLPFFARAVRHLSLIDRLRTRFEIAGIEASAENYLLLCCILAAGSGCMGILLGKPPLFSMLAGFVIGFGFPHFYVGRKLAKRKKRFLQLFPDGIDLIVRGLRAGLPVGKSMQTVSQEIGPPVGLVFKDVVEQIALGMNLEEALSVMAKRLDLTEFNFFVTSIILQRETGGNLAEILANLSEVLRQRHIMRLKIKAMSSEARASAAIVGSLPFLVGTVLMVISPGYLDPLVDDPRGNLAALYAVGSLSFGVFIMTRLSSFEI